MDKRILIIGAGPAGLMAAGQAARLGAKVTLLEKMARPGIKLSLAGNSRGNLTHIGLPEDFVRAFGKNGRFLRQAFSQFFNQDLLDFFQELGVETVLEQEGKYYTKSGLAAQAVEALQRWVQKSGVELKLNSALSKLRIENDTIKGVELKDGSIIEGDAMLIATGGASYPATGSTGDGFVLAQEVGHKVLPSIPALVPLVTEGTLAPELQGVSLSDVKVKAVASGKEIAEAMGGVLFTHFGLSGPAILSVSGDVAEALANGLGPVVINLDLIPERSLQAVDDDLINRLDGHGRMMVKTLLAQRMTDKTAAAVLESAGVPQDMPGHQLSRNQRSAIVRVLKEWRFDVRAPRPLNEAMVTRGGVDVREIDPRTMMSRRIKGLYFAGEVIDVDGDTGGYNLQAAFSTGFVAGHAMAR